MRCRVEERVIIRRQEIEVEKKRQEEQAAYVAIPKKAQQEKRLAYFL